MFYSDFREGGPGRADFLVACGFLVASVLTFVGAWKCYRRGEWTQSAILSLLPVLIGAALIGTIWLAIGWGAKH